jgi:hypothetical protein
VGLALGANHLLVRHYAFAQAPTHRASTESENWPTSPYRGAIDGNGVPIPCLCLHKGRKFELGERACLVLPHGSYLARCDYQQNNPSWIPTTDPCVVSERPMSFQSRKS